MLASDRISLCYNIPIVGRRGSSHLIIIRKQFFLWNRRGGAPTDYIFKNLGVPIYISASRNKKKEAKKSYQLQGCLWENNLNSTITTFSHFMLVYDELWLSHIINIMTGPTFHCGFTILVASGIWFDLLNTAYALALSVSLPPSLLYIYSLRLLRITHLKFR